MFMPSLSPEDRELLNLLNRRPELEKRVRSIVSIATDDEEGIVKADGAENRLIGEVRRTGNEALTGRAENRIEKSAGYLPADCDAARSGKKNSMAHDLRRNYSN
jgi:hypothetical protein